MALNVYWLATVTPAKVHAQYANSKVLLSFPACVDVVSQTLLALS